MKHKDFILKLFDLGIYSCTEDGRIFSMSKHNISGKPISRFLKKRISSTGYDQYVLSYNGKKIFVHGHSIVYLYFNRNADFHGKHINHKDLNKQNTALSNLELVSIKDNVHHAISLGRRGLSAKLKKEQVLEIKNSKLSCSELIVNYGVSKSTINNIKFGRTWLNI